MVRRTHDAAFRLSYSVPMSRVRTERPTVTRTPIEVDMQVIVGSTGETVHRPMLDPRGIAGTVLKTACGVDIAGQYYRTRPESYLGELCPLCFTEAERLSATDYSTIVARRRSEEAARLEAERDKWFEEHARRRTERMLPLAKPDPVLAGEREDPEPDEET